VNSSGPAGRAKAGRDGFNAEHLAEEPFAAPGAGERRSPRTVSNAELAEIAERLPGKGLSALARSAFQIASVLLQSRVAADYRHTDAFFAQLDD